MAFFSPQAHYNELGIVSIDLCNLVPTFCDCCTSANSTSSRSYEIKKNVASQSSSNLDPLLQQDLPVPLKIVSENLTTIIANAKENKVCEFCII